MSDKIKVCSVCYRRFVGLSGGANGCPAHGLRSPAKLTGKLLAREVVKWASAPGHGGNPYSHTFAKIAQAMLGEE